jgi:ketosteroid isomerase-like protein
VKHIYAWFAKGDGASILATFADDIEFKLAEGHPYHPSGSPWIGKQAITEHFLMKAGPEWENWTVRILATIATEDAVVMEGRYNGVYKPTGRTMDLQVCHVWRFAGDKVRSFHQYLDSAALQQVMQR